MTENSLRENFDKNYAEILKNISAAAKHSGRKAEDIILLAATKTVSPSLINYAIERGINYIGENRVQEMLSKEDKITNNVHRHFIGHLQTNKVKDIVPKVEMIQSVHSYKLAKAISDFCEKTDRVMPVLLEINIGNEESKSGFTENEIFCEIEKIAKLKGIFVKGLMAIPPKSDKNTENVNYFSKMHKLFIDIRGKNIDNISMDILSMGMSSDYASAIENGANLVRIGTSLFGERNYF